MLLALQGNQLRLQSFPASPGCLEQLKETVLTSNTSIPPGIMYHDACMTRAQPPLVLNRNNGVDFMRLSVNCTAYHISCIRATIAPYTLMCIHMYMWQVIIIDNTIVPLTTGHAYGFHVNA